MVMTNNLPDTVEGTGFYTPIDIPPPAKKLLIMECPKCHIRCYSNEEMKHEEGCEDYGFN